MKILLIILFVSAGISLAQKCYVESFNGTVKAQIGSGEKWNEIKPGVELPAFSTISTDKNSSVVLLRGNIKFKLKESSAIIIDNIKKMSLDELLLALAMEDMISAPRKKEESKSKSTQVYGNPNNTEKTSRQSNNEFGLKRLNGAKQLGENGFSESAIIAAKETYRKYPETAQLIDHRIYFADLLYQKSLYEEAFAEFSSFKDYKMTDKEKAEVDSKLDLLSKKIINR